MNGVTGGLRLVFPVLLGQLNRLPDQLIEVERLEHNTGGVLAAEFAHVSHHAGGIIGAGVDDLQALPHLLVIRKFLGVLQQQLTEPDNRGQRIVKVMGNAAGHLAEDAQVFLLNGLVLGPPQFAKCFT